VFVYVEKERGKEEARNERKMKKPNEKEQKIKETIRLLKQHNKKEECAKLLRGRY